VAPADRLPPALADLEADLRRAVAGPVRFDAATRAVYATDASNFRQPPIGVVLPASIDDVVAVHAVCRAHSAPVLPRGGGTSLSGSAVNRAVIIDCSAHLDAVGPVDPGRRLVYAEAGAINDRVNEAAAAHGLRFGPDPSTHASCTIGGNVGANACGVHSLQARFDGAGSRTSDNLASLDVLTYDGLRLTVGPTPPEEFAAIVAAGGRRGEIYRGLGALVERFGDEIRRRFPAIPRRVSGYNLDDLLPERGCNVAAALAGSEGTCVTILGATLKLIPKPPAHCLLIAGYPELPSVTDHLGEILAARPAGCEMFDRMLVPAAAERAAAGLPDGQAWVLVELPGASGAEARDRAEALAGVLRRAERPPTGIAVIDDAQAARRLWGVRETGLARAAFPPGAPAGPPSCPGWEDSAVAPEDAGAYLRDLTALCDRYGYRGSFYGHLGDGCIHARLNFDLARPSGIARYRRFLTEAAGLVVSYGGSLSGEHGDGPQRSELLTLMFGAEIVAAFQAFKAVWDPGNRMNPGRIVAPDRLDRDLRPLALAGPGLAAPAPLAFAYPESGGSLAGAAGRCVGFGTCRRRETTATMCPSFLVTRDERHTTRGRAHLLGELLSGNLEGGWRSDAVREALDLCLACKGCLGECPTGVDMATYKAEFLHQHWRGRLRPRAAYALGFVDRSAALASRLPEIANRLARTPAVHRLACRAAGIAAQRSLPELAPVTLQQWFRRRGVRNPGGPRAILWPDTFTNYFTPAIGVAAVEALEQAGWQVLLPGGRVCCGRPRYDYGFLAAAERSLQRSLRALRPLLAPGIPVVGLEPTCVATFRHELPRMLPRDDEALVLSRQVLHFAEFLTRYGVALPTPGSPATPGAARASLWAHCHQRATGGVEADLAVLRAMGWEAGVAPGTCCGLAGGWGYQPEHQDLSLACAEAGFFPAVRAAGAAGAGSLIVANGFSCRRQLADGLPAARPARHLAEVLRSGQLTGAPAGAGAAPPGAGAAPPGNPPAPYGIRLRRAALAGGAALAALAGALALLAAAVGSLRRRPGSSGRPIT
jgi:FAD/FMN-containing dehydrogenase/Fe-S oxidoreductase